MANYHVLKGNRVNDDETYVPDTLMVEPSDRGWLDSAGRLPIEAYERAVATDDIRTLIVGIGVRFEPAAGECARVGIPVRPFADIDRKPSPMQVVDRRASGAM
jgi:hypothetical protein